MNIFFLRILTGNGTFLFNGIFPIDDGVDFNMQSGFMMYQAMKFAIKVVGLHLQINTKMLLNIDLVFDIWKKYFKLN